MELAYRKPSFSDIKEKRTKAALAGITATESSVILMDEPGTCFTPESMRQIAEYIKTLNNYMVTLIMANHNLKFAAHVSHRALILSGEHRLAVGRPDVQRFISLSPLFCEPYSLTLTQRQDSGTTAFS